MHETNDVHSCIDDIVYIIVVIRMFCIDDIVYNCGHMNIFCLKSVDVIDDLKNFSDYCVVQCIFTVKGKVETFVDDERNDQYTYVWNNHNRKMYYQTTGVLLQNLLIWCENNSFSNCNLMGCTNNIHL